VTDTLDTFDLQSNLGNVEIHSREENGFEIISEDEDANDDENNDDDEDEDDTDALSSSPSIPDDVRFDLLFENTY
jgi:hypothetical protein